EREKWEEKIEKITETILQKISKRLGFRANHRAETISGSEGHYGSVLTTGPSMSLVLEQRQAL
ncbi:MAG TPA: hypothetical protein DF383_09160, partial [Deltaproteobacteria bacterium]|nr:hypothetical protein [Deltaproteobacteria bacterium]